MSAYSPRISNVERYSGIGGQYCVSADVTYLGESTQRAHFIGNVYGEPGPVVIVTDCLPEGAYVTDPGRFGHELSAQWVRNYYA